MSTDLEYLGNVTISLIINDKKITISNHNAGLPQLWESICWFLSGNSVSEIPIPKQLDVRNSDDESILYYRPVLSGNRIEKGISNCSAYFNVSLNTDILNVSEIDSNGNKLVLCQETSDATYDFAEISISALDLQKITPGVQAIIEWSLQIKNSQGE